MLIDTSRSQVRGIIGTMRCDATDGNANACTLPQFHAGRHLAWTIGPVGGRDPVMWHDERTHAQRARLLQVPTAPVRDCDELRSRSLDWEGDFVVR